MKYEVIIKEIEKYCILIDDADSGKDAETQAYEVLENCKDKGVYHDDSESEADACEVNY